MGLGGKVNRQNGIKLSPFLYSELKTIEKGMCVEVKNSLNRLIFFSFTKPTKNFLFIFSMRTYLLTIKIDHQIYIGCITNLLLHTISNFISNQN